MLDARRNELLRRQRLDLQRDLQALDSGELWHPMTEDAYRQLLLDGLDEINAELAGEEPPYRPDDSGREW